MFDIVALEGCPYSAQAVDLLTAMSQRHPNFKFKVTWVNASNKQKYKTPDRQTFPQISFQVKTTRGVQSIYVGGCENLEELISWARQLKTRYGAQIIVPLLQLMNGL